MTVLYTILGILAALAVILLAVLFIKVRIVFSFTKNHGEKAKNSIRITFFGEKLGFDLKDLSWKNKKKKEEKVKEKVEEKEKILDKIKGYIKTFKILREVYSKNKYFIKKRLVLENTNVSVKFGLGDAAVTGIAIGAVWTLLYSILAFLSCIGTVRDHEFKVDPVYNETGLEMDVNGIISFRLINIIRVVVKLVRTYRAVIRVNK